MTSLTKISITARKAIRYTIYFMVFLIVGRIFLNAGIKIYKKVFPPPTPAPTVKFGKLTKIPFPQNGITAKLNYVLETADGNLPTNIPSQAKVYYLTKNSANLLSLDTAKSKATSLGFLPDPQQISDTIYKFRNQNYPVTMQMNIITGTFSISYDLAADSSPINLRPPVADVAASEFTSFLSDGNLLPDDLSGTITHDFLKVSNGQLVSALSLSEANFVKVNLFRKDYDNLPCVTGNPNQANVWAIVSGSNNQEQQIIAAEYHYHSVDETQYSTYPIKTPQEAFSELQNNQAFIASIGLNNDGDTLKIRHIYLAYFDPDSDTDYFQPIYVFEGDNGFVSYLPAVTSEYYDANSVASSTPVPTPQITASPSGTPKTK